MNKVSFYYRQSTRPHRDLDRMFEDEYQSGYVTGWDEAEYSRGNRRAITMIVAFTIGMIAGHFLSMLV